MAKEGAMAMMTVEEKRDRAATRAGEAHLPVYRIPFGYVVPSGRLSDVAWVVALSAGEPRCDCPGFVYHGACIHSETVRRYLTAGIATRSVRV
jgi:hypothetical protein